MAATNNGALNSLNLKLAQGVVGIKILGGGHPNATDAGMADTAYRHMGWSKDITFRLTDVEEFKEDGQPSPGIIYYSTSGGLVEVEMTLQEVSETNWDLNVIAQGRNPLYYTAALNKLEMITDLPPLRVALKFVVMPAVVGSDRTAIPNCECFHVPLAYISVGTYERLTKPAPQNERNYIKFMANGVADETYDFKLYGNSILTADVTPDAAPNRRFFAAAKPFADIIT